MPCDMVEIECKDNSRFFLEHLYICISGGTIDNPLIIMSDKQKICNLSYSILRFACKLFDKIIWFMF